MSTPVFVGHAAARQALERELPPVALLTGPPSVGKWTLTQHLGAHHQVAMADWSPHPDGLSVDGARALTRFLTNAPFGALKLATIGLDGCTSAALNALLKTLEEPPPYVRFLLTASGPVLPTVASRAQIFRLGLLSTDELARILVSGGMSPAAAAKAATLGRGQVDAALRAASRGDAAHATVLSLLRALGTGDAELYDKTFRGFDADARDLLLIWLREAITGQWAAFAPGDSYGLAADRRRLVAMLASLSRLASASPRLAVRTALEPYLAPA